jgi:hypothetical protein
MISMRDESVPGIPLPAEAGPRKWDWRLSVSSILGLVPIIAALVLIVPEFDRVYRQVKVQMPDSTMALLEISNAMCQYLWLVGIGVALFSYDIGRWTGRKAKLARVLIPVLTIVVGLWMFVALFSPLLCLDHGIGPRRH